jgi:flagellar protein FliS
MTGYSSYTRTDIRTADPRTVVVLLYEGIVKFLAQAEAALQENQRMEMSEHINRALRIIHHLASGLDFDAGGEIAENLSNLYGYMRDVLLGANINCDESKIQEVSQLAKDLLESWRQVATDPKAAQALEARDAFAPPSPSEGANENDASSLESDTTSPLPGSEKQQGDASSPQSTGTERSAKPPTEARGTSGQILGGHRAYGIR